MIQIIAGEKGKGKTKIVLDKANGDVTTALGSVIYIDKSNQHMYELNNKIRLINATEYFVNGASEFIGFITGMISQNHDITSIYLDSFLKLANLTAGELDPVMERLEQLSAAFDVKFVISISANVADISPKAKELVSVAL